MNKTILYVAEEISENYGLDLSKSKSIVEKSWFSEILRENPDYVQHYTADYWAKEIMKDFVGNEEKNNRKW